MADPEANLGGGGLSRPEGPSGGGYGRDLPSCRWGFGGPPPRKF